MMRLRMSMSELRQVIRESMMAEYSDFTDLEIRDWVIYEFLGLGFHTDFLKYLLQFRDASKSVLDDNFGSILTRMDRARDLDPIDDEPEFGEINHPATLMKFFVGRIKPNPDQKIQIGMRLDSLGSDRLEDIIDGIHRHRVKYSRRTDRLGRPVYY